MPKAVVFQSVTFSMVPLLGNYEIYECPETLPALSTAGPR
jgi:hypothetical protein